MLPSSSYELLFDFQQDGALSLSLCLRCGEDPPLLSDSERDKKHLSKNVEPHGILGTCETAVGSLVTDGTHTKGANKQVGKL